MLFDEKLLKQQMQNVVTSFEQDLKSFRTGRLTLDVFQKIEVDTTEEYGSVSNLLALSKIVLVSSTRAEIEIWDYTLINKIKSALENSIFKFSVNQSSERKNLLIVTVQPLTQESRDALLKEMSKILEEKKVRLRNIRHEFINKLEKLEKVSEDEVRRSKNQIQSILKEFEEKLESIFEEKKVQLFSHF